MTMPRDIATRPEAQMPAIPARRYLAVEGLEELTLEEDLILPRWRLRQYSSRIAGDPGQFNNNLTGEIRESLNLIVLKVVPSRAYFDKDRRLVCLSRDGVTGSAGQLCFTCPYAEWGKDREAPLCSRGYTFFCLDPEDDSLCLIGALRTSVKPAKLYISLLADKKQPPFHFMTHFSSVPTEGPKGKFFVLAIDPAYPLTDEDAQRAGDMYRFLAGVRIEEVKEPAGAEDLGVAPEEEVPF